VLYLKLFHGDSLFAILVRSMWSGCGQYLRRKMLKKSSRQGGG